MKLRRPCRRGGSCSAMPLSVTTWFGGGQLTVRMYGGFAAVEEHASVKPPSQALRRALVRHRFVRGRAACCPHVRRRYRRGGSRVVATVPITSQRTKQRRSRRESVRPWSAAFLSQSSCLSAPLNCKQNSLFIVPKALFIASEACSSLRQRRSSCVASCALPYLSAALISSKVALISLS